MARTVEILVQTTTPRQAETGEAGRRFEADDASDTGPATFPVFPVEDEGPTAFVPVE